MIIASKYLPLILALSDTAAAKDSTLSRLRGQIRHLPGNGNGNGWGALKKLSAEGCTVLEKAYHGCPPLNEDSEYLPCNDEKREFACEDVSTGQIYRVEDDLIDISKGNKPGLDIDNDAEVLESANALFVGDADIDAAGGIRFNRGRFLKAKANDMGGNPNHKEGDRLLKSIGSHTVLALNVISSEGNTTGYDNFHLADSVFGSLVGGPDPVNLASQFKACSHGKFDLSPLPDQMSSNVSIVGDVTYGVATVYSVVSTASGQGAMREDARSKLAAAHGQKGGAGFVMMCLPVRFTPYAYINHWLSVYPNNACLKPSIQLHEVGHNLGLGHSGEGDNGYGDQSGFMGSGSSGDDPKKCFNGPKSWQLGWFSDRHVTLTFGVESFSGRIYGTTQYDTTTEAEKMILRLHDPSCTTCDYYVSFNHAASYNSQTQEGKDKVQVHTKPGSPSPRVSRVVARLDSGGSYTATVNGADMYIAVSSVNATEGWAEIVVAPGASAAPTTATPTESLAPTMSPTKAPTTPTLSPTDLPTASVPETGSYFTACGSSTETCSGQSAPADVNELHELRCCAETPLPGFSKHSLCPLQVWSESNFDGTCYHDVNWNEGRSICASYGARLCTKDELLADCSHGSGCQHNEDMIWSSTRVAPTSSPTTNPSVSPSVSPTKNPTSGPTTNPSASPSTSPTRNPTQNPTTSPTTSPTGSPTTSPTTTPSLSPTKKPSVSPSLSPTKNPSESPSSLSYNFLLKVVCGSTAGSCRHTPVLLANVAEAHEVRCCSDTAKTGWVKKTECAVWGESHLPSCNEAKTFDEAEAICAANGARLCTESELLDDCAHGSGCGFNDQHIWSSSTVPKCTDDASCDDGLPCTTDACGVDGKCTNEAIGCGKIVACGSTANECIAPYVKGADVGELHEVRCCSDVAKSGWILQPLCSSTLGRDVWGQSNGSLGSCNAAKTYAEAEAICLAGDSRLCTTEEVRADCTRGSGCGFDWEHVWTSDDNTASASGGLFNL